MQTETEKIADRSKTDLVLKTDEENKGNEPEATDKGTTGVEVAPEKEENNQETWIFG